MDTERERERDAETEKESSGGAQEVANLRYMLYRLTSAAFCSSSLFPVLPSPWLLRFPQASCGDLSFLFISALTLHFFILFSSPSRMTVFSTGLLTFFFFFWLREVFLILALEIELIRVLI